LLATTQAHSGLADDPAHCHAQNKDAKLAQHRSPCEVLAGSPVRSSEML